MPATKLLLVSYLWGQLVVAQRVNWANRTSTSTSNPTASAGVGATAFIIESELI
jgi:hypothetical protein